jgi:hypothetical protein
MNSPATRKASFHCGAVVFELTLPQGLVDLRRCNCSICRMRGAVAASVAVDGLHVTSGEDKLTL